MDIGRILFGSLPEVVENPIGLVGKTWMNVDKHAWQISGLCFCGVCPGSVDWLQLCGFHVRLASITCLAGWYDWLWFYSSLMNWTRYFSPITSPLPPKKEKKIMFGCPPQLFWSRCGWVEFSPPPRLFFPNQSQGCM